jgi:FtsP/CotA-like multicopper oxidase with cupredoxin domain
MSANSSAEACAKAHDRRRQLMEATKMANHCDSKRTTAVVDRRNDERPTPGVDDGAVVRYRLEASEIEWEIAPGRTVRGYGFNGQVPGPVLEAKQGVPLEIEYTNRLPEPTVIHWHGLRIPAAMDGTEVVQRPVQPGETFVYRFTPPDAGTFWYHPHLNETEQLEKGLYGALIVRGPDELTLDDEQILVFDDLRVDKTGQIAKFGGLMDRHNGREGNVRLINGRSEPELTIAAGQIERWRIVNASSARYVRLSLGGKPFQIIGTDGGLIEAPVTATEVLLPPADRVELAVGPFENDAAVLNIEDLPYYRMAGRKGIQRFGTIRVTAQKPSTAGVPARLREIAPLVSGEPKVTRTVTLGFKLSLRRGLDFVVNGEPHHHDEPVKVGELQVWDVVNATRMDHPFHLHGFFFQVLAINGKKPAWRSLEDVVNVPPLATVRIAWYPDDRPGSWMYHCHILEHHASGMMGHFDVVR